MDTGRLTGGPKRGRHTKPNNRLRNTHALYPVVSPGPHGGCVPSARGRGQKVGENMADYTTVGAFHLGVPSHTPPARTIDHGAEVRVLAGCDYTGGYKRSKAAVPVFTDLPRRMLAELP